MPAQNMPEQEVAKGVLRTISRFLVVTGVVLVGVYVAARLHSIVMSKAALQQFGETGQKRTLLNKRPRVPEVERQQTDFSLWSMKRIAAYEASLSAQFAAPEAVLEIPKIGLEVPLFDGTDDLTLNRGVGRIEGTAHPGQKGNVGIAGHRDGFFRGLKDVAVGDKIELKMHGTMETYRVDQVRIVKPTDVEILKDRNVATLTLVTCYPFYFIGNAPLRYVVQASLLHKSANGKESSQPN